MAFAAHQHLIPLFAEPSAIPKPSSIAASPAPSTSSLAPLSLLKFDSRRWRKPLRRIGSQFRYEVSLLCLCILIFCFQDYEILARVYRIAWSITVCDSGNHPHPTSKAKSQDSEVSVGADAFSQFKHVLFPITNSNPYLSEGTRQAAATTTSLAKKYGARITVVVIDDRQEESLPELETQLDSIRWHLSEGGFQEFQLLERRGEGKKPTAIIGEIADDMGLDLVVLSMEAIHSKHVDANLLAEFVPCPVLLLPL
ncbi:hypothetical protein AKJ16_DCAP22985 [Drosera capensis]